MRTLLVCREGAPLFTEITAGPIREFLRTIDGLDDVDLYQIWEVHPLEHGHKAQDITKRFALSWAREIEFGEGIEPSDYLAPFPAFVRELCASELHQRWAAEMAPIELPNPIRRVA
jgi:hypothetical protein